MQERQKKREDFMQHQKPIEKRPWRKPELVELPMGDTAHGTTAGPEGVGPFGSAVGLS